jgi:hypothetical protein
MSDKPEIYSWKYKTTIIIDTPEGEKSGSAVREMTFSMSPCARREVEPCRAEVSTKGEAVVIDLGKRGIVFSTMTDSSYYAVFDLFPGPPGETIAGVKYYSSLKNAKASLNQSPFPTYPTTQYPMMVTFKDMKDPKTVVAVDRANLETEFGTGVKIRDVIIEMTDEDVTREISKHLVWLDSLNGGYLHGGFTSRDSPMGLYGGNFKLGEKNEQ